MRVTITLLFIIILCTGCMPKNYIEQLGIITAVGFDTIGEDKIRGTMVIYQFDPTSSSTSQVVTSEAQTSKGVRFEANRLTSHKLVSGQVRLSMYGKELASKGLMKYMDTLSRDANITDMGYLAISDVDSSELLNSKNSEDSTNTGLYIQKLIEKSVNNEMVPKSLLIIFMRDYHDIGIDPVLPLLSLNNQKTIINGIALLQNDRMVATLPEEDIFYLMLLKSEFENGEYQIQLPKDSLNDFLKTKNMETDEEQPLHVSLHEMTSKISYKPKKGDPTVQSINIQMEARLLEITKDVDLKNKKAIKRLEKVIEKEIKENSHEVLDKLKEAKVDPIGFGKLYNSKNRTNRVTKDQWHDQIPELNVSINIDFKLLRHGITE